MLQGLYLGERHLLLCKYLMAFKLNVIGMYLMIRTSSPSPDTGQEISGGCSCPGVAHTKGQLLCNMPPPCNTPEDQQFPSFTTRGKQPLGLFLIVPAVHHRQGHGVRHSIQTIEEFSILDTIANTISFIMVKYTQMEMISLVH